MMKILAFFAHPDDETMLAGGTLALLAEAGAEVHFLCATRGEGGERGEPPLTAQETLGRVREEEMNCAVRELGGKSLVFLGYKDPLVGPEDSLFAYTQDLARLAEELIDVILQTEVDAIITHGSGGEYGHPAHIITHQAARLAVESITHKHPEHSLLLYTVQSMFPDHPKPRLANKEDEAHLVIDVSSVMDRKERAALCHRTQHALFVRRASQKAGRQLTVPEVLVLLESLHRAYPPGDADANDPLLAMLRPFTWRPSVGESGRPQEE